LTNYCPRFVYLLMSDFLSTSYLLLHNVRLFVHVHPHMMFDLLVGLVSHLPNAEMLDLTGLITFSSLTSSICVALCAASHWRHLYFCQLPPPLHIMWECTSILRPPIHAAAYMDPRSVSWLHPHNIAYEGAPSKIPLYFFATVQKSTWYHLFLPGPSIFIINSDWQSHRYIKPPWLCTHNGSGHRIGPYITVDLPSPNLC